MFSTVGDSLLARGMQGVGSVSLHTITCPSLAILNPWVALWHTVPSGVFLLLHVRAFMADLTYVLPATSLSYVLVALVG